MQSRLGVREDIEPWARKVVRPFMPEQHRDFYRQLPFVVAAARDADGRPWATLLTGAPGFIRSPDPGRLLIDAAPLTGDALAGALQRGTALGLLGIELDTRRRNRANGVIEGAGATLEFVVGQAFGNCPQYITERSWREAGSGEIGGRFQVATALDDGAIEFIRRADTFFIASGYDSPRSAGETRGMDASHRGGPPGFVEIADDSRLVFPDYPGNNHFNTLGNLVVDPRVGLLFVDFEGGSVLQITGRAGIDWDSPDVGRYPGAQRLVVVDIEEVRRLEQVLPIRWAPAADRQRDLVLVDRTAASSDVASFEFAAAAGTLEPFTGGQHLPIEIRLPGSGRPLSRTYSLSNASAAGTYRISVKRHRHGLVSRYLHDQLAIGDVIRATAPAGDFVIRPGENPIVLVSAGIGITPMIGMLHELARTADPRPVRFVHGARDGLHHALREDVVALAERHPNIRTTIVYSQPAPGDRRGVDFDRTGRIDSRLLDELVEVSAADFYVCGPAGFMAELTAGLESRGAAGTRIFTETF